MQRRPVALHLIICRYARFAICDGIQARGMREGDDEDVTGESKSGEGSRRWERSLGCGEVAFIADRRDEMCCEVRVREAEEALFRTRWGSARAFARPLVLVVDCESSI